MEAEKNIRNIRKSFKEAGIFYTTDELAGQLKEYVDFTPTRIYDPTCGQGNLLSVFPDEIEKYGQEIFKDELDKAEARLKNFHGYCGDTLKDDGFKDIQFDLIVANPPFSIKWEPNESDERFKEAPALPPPSKADNAFMLHILHHLAPNGKAICLEFPGILYRGQREGAIRRWLVDQNYIERIVHIPGNTFVDTKISTCVVVLNKTKANTDIIFEDKELNLTRTVAKEEIVQNDYVLSVSTYIALPEEKEDIDAIELENTARLDFLRRLRKELEFDREICRMEGISIMPFIDKIRSICDEYEERSTE